MMTGEVYFCTAVSRERSSSAEMIVFLLKQILSLKRAILGRREPHQLAWGVALGVLLGIVPHGNLMAAAILIVILSLRVNHGMVAITAVLISFFASRLDGQTHLLGRFLLTHPTLGPHFSTAWQLPLVPWMDINNTIVTGSLAAGLVALLPIYLIGYPVFSRLAPAETGPEFAADGVAKTADPTDTDAVPNEVGSTDMATSVAAAESVTTESVSHTDARIEVSRVPRTADNGPAEISASELSERTSGEAFAALEAAARSTDEPDPPMSEALNYLLRQLRDSRPGRAA